MEWSLLFALEKLDRREVSLCESYGIWQERYQTLNFVMDFKLSRSGTNL